MVRKVKVAILFGGKSAEHEVSLRSARNVAEAIDKNKYEVVLIGIDREGHWLPPQKSAALLGSVSVPSSDTGIALAPGENGLITSAEEPGAGRIDVFFPILHGPFGEDGTVQGLLRLANVPFARVWWAYNMTVSLDLSYCFSCIVRATRRTYPTHLNRVIFNLKTSLLSGVI